MVPKSGTSLAADELRCDGAGSGRWSFQHFIFKRHAFPIVFLIPGFSGVDVREYLEVVGIANLLAGVDVDQDCFHRSLLGARLTGLLMRSSIRSMRSFRRELG
jgi:hypothetical protein